MSFLKRLFGGGDDGGESSPAAAETEHDGYLIAATPIREGGQFRLCAMIRKQIGGEMKEHRMIRADVFQSADEASEAALRKARQVIAEQGDAMFG